MPEPQPSRLRMRARKKGKEKVFRQARSARSLITSPAEQVPHQRNEQQMGSYAWKERDCSGRKVSQPGQGSSLNSNTGAAREGTLHKNRNAKPTSIKAQSELARLQKRAE